MRLLLDTQLLLWISEWEGPGTRPVPAAALALVEDTANALHFSAVSIWEVAVKAALKRSSFDADPVEVRRGLLDNGYQEVSVTSLQAIGVANLPLLHGDPFDRLLIAQAIAERLTLLTVDAKIARYPGPILQV